MYVIMFLHLYFFNNIVYLPDDRSLLSSSSPAFSEAVLVSTDEDVEGPLPPLSVFV